MASTVIFDHMMKKYPDLKKKLTEKQISRVKDLIKGHPTDSLTW